MLFCFEFSKQNPRCAVGADCVTTQSRGAILLTSRPNELEF